VFEFREKIELPLVCSYEQKEVYDMSRNSARSCSNFSGAIRVILLNVTISKKHFYCRIFFHCFIKTSVFTVF